MTSKLLTLERAPKANSEISCIHSINFRMVLDAIEMLLLESVEYNDNCAIAISH